jgi:succinyl-CoA synthetase beta subunit
MLAERRDPEHEYYAAILNDRSRQTPVLVTSSQGGMNIEDVARDTPDAIITTPIDFSKGLDKTSALELATKLGFKTQKTREEAADIFIKLYQIYKDKDATQIEINPLAETADGHVLWYVTPSRVVDASKLLGIKHGCEIQF